MSSLLKSAQQYQQVINNTDLRHQVFSVSPIPNGMSFQEAAEMLLEDVSGLDPEGKDTDLINAAHKVMGILNNFTLPTATQLLDAATSLNNQIQAKSQDRSVKNMGKYLLSLTNILIFKFYQQHPQATNQPAEMGTGQSSPALTPTSFSQFLVRLYRSFQGQGAINDSDRQMWNKNKQTYADRMNALMKMPQRNKQQNEELYVLRYVMEKMNKLPVNVPAV